MRVVIRLRPSHRDLSWAEESSRRWAAATALVLGSLALICAVLCVWRWSFDLQFVRRFVFDQDPFIRWQFWFGLAVVFQFLASRAMKYARHLTSTEEAERAKLRSSLGRRAA